MWTVLLLGATAALLAAPIAPALLEWLRQRGARPLGIDPNHAARTAHFADTLRECAAAGGGADPALEWKGPLVFPDGGFPAGERRFRGSVDTGGRARVGGALVEGDLVLGPGSTVGRWAHARRVEVGERAVLHGRVSADVEITLAAPCRFTRVSAPTIRCGGQDPTSARPVRAPLATGPGPTTAERRVVAGDLAIPPGSSVRGDLVVRGALVVGSGSRIEGSVKAHGGIRVGEGAEVTGAIVAVEAVHVGPRCAIAGPLVSETAVDVGAGARLGAVEQQTTVTAPAIAVHPGAVVHGTLWARDGGEVLAAVDPAAAAPVEAGAHP